MKRAVSLFVGLCLLFLTLPANAAEETVHVVKPGDTLWDISAQYLQTPWEWPLVWSRNADITNPHLIYPGDQVIISRENGKTIIRIVRTPQEEPAAAPEEEVYTPEELAKDEGHRLVVSPQYSSLIYSATELSGAGKVLKKQGIGSMASVGDTVLIKMTTDVTPGQNIAVVSRLLDVKKDKQDETSLGYLYKVIAMAKVRDTQAGLVRARITYATREVEADDIVYDTPEAINPVTVDLSEPLIETGGHVVELYGAVSGGSSKDLVFLDLGSAAGLRTGSLLDLNQEISFSEGEDLPPVTFKEYQGLVLVLQALENSAMGLVLEAKKPIERGFAADGSSRF